MNYSDLVVEARRLALLTILEASAGYEAGDALLQMQAEALGHVASLGTIQADLAWLRDAGLALVRELPRNVQIATITTRGLDVAKGRTTVPGVARPAPGAL